MKKIKNVDLVKSLPFQREMQEVEFNISGIMNKYIIRFHACVVILEIVDDTGFENLVEPVNVSSEPSDHSPHHNEGKMLIIMQTITVFLTLTQVAMVH